MMNDVESVKVKRNLTALVEFSRIINSSLDLQFILNNILLTCMGKFFATKGLIGLNINGRIYVRSSKGIDEKVLDTFPEINAEDDLEVHDKFNKFLKANRLSAIERISSSNDMVGIVCLGEKLNKVPYSDDDLEFLRTIINISASAIQNSIVLFELSRVNRILDSRIHRLSSLFELSKEFGLISENSRVSKLLVYSIIGQFLVSKFAVVLSDGNKKQILESKFPKAELLKAIEDIDINKFESSITKEDITKKYDKLEALQIELVVPMQLHGETKGLILLGNRVNHAEFNETDIEFIYSIGSLAIISLENKRLFSEALEKQKMEEELEIARDIQKNLLPHKIPQYKRVDIAAYNIPSKQVGGDFYDIIPLDESSFCLAIADVSGKGVPAALLMANLQAFLKIICKHGMSLSEATELINDLVTENTMDGKFITFFWGVLDEKDLTFNYVNAGHNPPLLIRNKKIIKLDKGGIILGVMKTFAQYESPTITLEKEDIIVLFTDGITEAMNKNGEEFSDERLEELVIKSSDLCVEEITKNIQDAVQAFAAGEIQSDDITLLVVKVK
ncbi:MAG: PP2C family protein-serine/threonine phosphatase [Ignavibacteriaceae bacterium]|nr:PP2C family protein-serine/threonine phosphatase [Ignavibacteriaceae bacterium]